MNENLRKKSCQYKYFENVYTKMLIGTIDFGYRHSTSDRYQNYAMSTITTQRNMSKNLISRTI